MQYWDRLSLSAHCQSHCASDNTNGPESYCYPSATSSDLTKKWQHFNKASSFADDSWGRDSLTAILHVMQDASVDKKTLNSVLLAFNKQRFNIATKTKTLRQNPGWEFGQPRQQILRTPFNNKVTGFTYQSAVDLFTREHTRYACAKDPDADKMPGMQSVYTFTLPTDPLLGTLGSVTRFKSNNPEGDVFYDLNHFDHQRITEVASTIQRLYHVILNTNYTNATLCLRDIGQLHRCLAIICHFERGSSAIATWTAQMVGLLKGLPLFNPSSVFKYDIDFSAYLMTNNDFLDCYQQIAHAPVYTQHHERQKFIQRIYFLFDGKNTAPPAQIRAFECRLQKHVMQEPDIDYNLLTESIFLQLGLDKPEAEVQCCGFSLWTSPYLYNLNKVDIRSTLTTAQQNMNNHK